MEEMQEVLLVEISASCDSVSQSLKGKLNATNSRNERESEKQTICRVLKPRRELNPNAYEPRIASIGPYHRGKPSLAEMEKLKGGYLKKFLSRNPQTPLEDYITEVRRLEKRARGAYVEEFEMASDEFVEMMVLDGCFALELLLDKQWDHGLRNLNQNVFASLDLLLLENQVPFFILQALFNLNQPASSVSLCPRALVTIVYNGAHFDTSSSCNAAISIMSEKRGVDDVSHLLHLLYRVITRQRLQANKDPPRHWKLTAFLRVFMDKMKSLFGVIFPFSWVTESESENLDMTTIRCATKLKDAGITFKRKKNENNIFDITFEKGVLEIPKLHFCDETSSFILNLIAYEQSFAEENYLASYAHFMDCLINTGEDVAVLQENDIIDHQLGNNEDVAGFFNKSCKLLLMNADFSCLADVQKSVVAYTNKRRNRWRAKLKEDYFSNPWAFLSFLGAVVLLLLTVAQTIFSVLSYTNPST